MLGTSRRSGPRDRWRRARRRSWIAPRREVGRTMIRSTRQCWQAVRRVEVSTGGSHHAAALLLSGAQSGELLAGMTPGPEAEVRPSPSPVAPGTTFSTDWLGTAVAVSPPSPWSPRAALSAPSRVALSSPERRRSPQAPAKSREETPTKGHARPALAQAPVEPRTAVSGRICAAIGSTGARSRSRPRPGSPARGARTRRGPRSATAPPPWSCPLFETLAAPPAAGAEPGRTRRNAGAREAAPWA